MFDCGVMLSGLLLGNLCLESLDLGAGVGKQFKNFFLWEHFYIFFHISNNMLYINEYNLSISCTTTSSICSSTICFTS